MRAAIPAIAAMAASAAFVFAVPSPSAAEPEPAGSQAAASIRAFHDSGAWARERVRVAAAATTALERWRIANPDAEGVLVSDLDDTIVSWYRAYERTDFTAKAPTRWCAQPVIRPVAVLLDRARELGMDVVVLTGRSERARERTQACLARLGIDHDALVMREPGEERMSAARYKSRERAAIEATGATIVAAIGDQRSDLAGGHALALFRLPNPMYGIR